MKNKIVNSLILLLFGFTIFFSCRKNPAITSRIVINKPPIAMAGTDQTITLPVNSITLDGSGSFDPDNNLISYQWSKISGPSSYYLSIPNSPQPQVTNLIQGIYEFELTVIDAGGLTSKDSVEISVLPVITSEVIFTDQVWVNLCYQDLPGACWINGDSPSYGFTIKDTANLLPDSAAAILGVWVKMDTSNVWEKVPNNCWKYPDPYPQSNFTYCLSSDGLSIWSWFFS